jgi:hypothetical protein
MMYHDQNKHIRKDEKYFMSLYKRCVIQHQHELKLRSLDEHRRNAISQYKFLKCTEFLEIIHRPVFFFSKTMFPRPDSASVLRWKPTQLGSIERAIPYLWTPATTLDRIYKPNTS